MSKVIHIIRGHKCTAVGTDCDHWHLVDSLEIHVNDEIICPTCEDTSKQVKAARREALEEVKEPCMEMIKTTISQYRLQYTMDMDFEDMHLPLLDALTPPGRSSIEEGKEEMYLLIDEVQGQVLFKVFKLLEDSP